MRRCRCQPQQCGSPVRAGSGERGDMEVEAKLVRDGIRALSGRKVLAHSPDRRPGRVPRETTGEALTEEAREVSEADGVTVPGELADGWRCLGYRR